MAAPAQMRAWKYPSQQRVMKSEVKSRKCLLRWRETYMMNDAKGPYVGRREPSYKGSALVAGAAKYTNDLTFPRQLYAQFVRSPHANAQVASVDFSAAEKLSGVVLALDGAGAA